MPRLDAQVLALVGKHGARISAFKLGVLVVGVAQAGFDAVKPAWQLAHLAFQRVAGGLHANRHLVFGHGAVIALVGVDRCAQIAVVPESAGSESATPSGAGRVADAPGVGRRAGFCAVECNRHPHIAGAAVKTVQVQGITFVARLHQTGHAAFVVTRARLQLGLAQHARDCFSRYAVVDHVDHTAHGAAAIKQGGRAPKHFHTVGGQDIERHRVVVAQRRSIQAGGAVVQHPDAVAIEPANGGAAGVGAKVSAGHTGQTVQGLAQSALPALKQVDTAHRVDRHGGAVAAQRVAGDDDFSRLLRYGVLRPCV